MGFQGRNPTPIQPRVENKPIQIQRLTLAQMKEKRDKGFALNVTVNGDLAIGVEDRGYS
jgi:hypothetical protein